MHQLGEEKTRTIFDKTCDVLSVYWDLVEFLQINYLAIPFFIYYVLQYYIPRMYLSLLNFNMGST